MKRAVTYGIGLIVALFIIATLILTLSIDNIVRSNIEEVGSDMAGTQVTAEDVSISIFSGRGSIGNFRVSNPEGFETDDALVIDDFSIELNLRSLLSDTVVVKEIIINRPAVYVEQKLPDNNLRTILNNINEAASEPSTDSYLVIEHFLMQEGSADLYTEVGGERSARVEISTVELTDLGRGGGQKAVEQVVHEIAERVVEQALQSALRSGGEQLREAIEDIFN